VIGHKYLIINLILKQFKISFRRIKGENKMQKSVSKKYEEISIILKVLKYNE
jgi:hypothetical protein